MFSFILCLIAITIISLILFMPAFIELKKPKDNGPRQIMGVKLGYCGPLLYVEDEADHLKKSSKLCLFSFDDAALTWKFNFSIF